MRKDSKNASKCLIAERLRVVLNDCSSSSLQRFAFACKVMVNHRDNNAVMRLLIPNNLSFQWLPSLEKIRCFLPSSCKKHNKLFGLCKITACMMVALWAYTISIHEQHGKVLQRVLSRQIFGPDLGFEQPISKCKSAIGKPMKATDKLP